MKKTLLGLAVILMLLAVTGCTEKEDTNTKKTGIGKYVGEYTVTYSEAEPIEDITFKEKVTMKKCASKKDKDCLIKGGNDNQLAVMEDEEGLYLSVPVSFIVDEKKSEKGDEDFLNARICFEWDDYNTFTQVMCPPKDSNLFEKEDIDTKYYIRLSKELEENK